MLYRLIGGQTSIYKEDEQNCEWVLVTIGRAVINGTFATAWPFGHLTF